MDQSTNTSLTRFRDRPLEERNRRFNALIEKNPSKVPIIFERHADSKMQNFESLKFVSTRNLKIGYFACQVRNMLKLSPECALFFSCGKKKMIKHDTILGELYDECKSEDGFLYIDYRDIESFGCALNPNQSNSN